VNYNSLRKVKSKSAISRARCRASRSLTQAICGWTLQPTRVHAFCDAARRKSHGIVNDADQKLIRRKALSIHAAEPIARTAR